MKNVRILCVGDIVGRCGTELISERLWEIRKQLDCDMVIANGENASVGNGIEPQVADALFLHGCDVITGGNHTFAKNSIKVYLDDKENILRPANFPASCPGTGFCVYDCGKCRVLVMNLIGTVFMDSYDSPFLCADAILEREKGNYDIAVLDIHAEATSEKAAIARYLDGRVSAVFGTHTHVLTNDARIFEKGTGFITDIGMTGADDSILGVACEPVIRRFLTKMPTKFEEASGRCSLCGALFEIDAENGVCLSVSGVTYR